MLVFAVAVFAIMFVMSLWQSRRLDSQLDELMEDDRNVILAIEHDPEAWFARAHDEPDEIREAE